MIFLIQIFFWTSLLIIFWAMIGYPISIIILDKLLKPNENDKLQNYTPTVTIMVVAHNEEKVIEAKLNNLLEINYPNDKIRFLVASDNSSDSTNSIVDEFILNNKSYDIQLYKAKKRMGKTNAQNEAQKKVSTEYLVMTDANSMIEKNAIKELMASFSNDNISYVTGKLEYLNANSDNETSQSESTYWNLDLTIRNIESKLQTITAGNGALYAVRNDRYVDVDPIYSHDSEFPIIFGLREERAIMNSKALVYEKAGETDEDEFGRKVRMNRVLLDHILPSFAILNIVKYKWFTFFYLGHRTSRYLLWIAHLILLISSLALFNINIFYSILGCLQLIILIVGFTYNRLPLTNIIFKLINYYCMTIWAQFVGVYKVITGKAKPTWDKAESTR